MTIREDRAAGSRLDRQGLFVITGIMAAGKSTIAQLLAERFAKGVHVRGDIFRRMIVSGREEMTPGYSQAALDQLKLRYRLAAATAEAYFAAGFSVVVQDNIYGPDLIDFIQLICSRPLYVVVLCPRAEVVLAREASRGKRGYGEWTVEELDREFREKTPRIGLWLDT